MEYTTNDLSKILDVSTNTIRRFEEKGYLDQTGLWGNFAQMFLR